MAPVAPVAPDAENASQYIDATPGTLLTGTGTLARQVVPPLNTNWSVSYDCVLIQLPIAFKVMGLQPVTVTRTVGWFVDESFTTQRCGT